ncbi:MAG TPA: regulatory protein RecX [Gemmatimonadaceae bacterium]|nr:regulatory protein RecX [Gemmatimonadaceae bacterium]
MPAAPQLITAIDADPRRAGRFAVLVDGRPLFSLPIDVIERLDLRIGTPVAPLREQLDREVAALKTYDRAVNMLTARARSARDLERQLVRKGEPAEHAKAAVERLRAAGFLDDAAFARSFARSRSLGAALASRRLRQELARRGVERTVADEAVSEVLEEENVDEQANAERVARKRLRSLEGVDVMTRRRRLYALLARRGYDPDTISKVLRRVLGAAAGDDEEPAAGDSARD